MGVELPEQESHPENDQTAASIATSDSILVDLPATPADAPPALTESILHAPSRPAKAADIAGTEERPIDLTSSEPIFSPASDPSASTGLTATGPPTTLTDEQELQLATFCDIASSDKDFARSILDVCCSCLSSLRTAVFTVQWSFVVVFFCFHRVWAGI